MLNPLKFVIGMLSNKIYNGNRTDWNLPPPPKKKKKQKTVNMAKCKTTVQLQA